MKRMQRIDVRKGICIIGPSPCRLPMQSLADKPSVPGSWEVEMAPSAIFAPRFNLISSLALVFLQQSHGAHVFRAREQQRYCCPLSPISIVYR